MQKVFKLMVVLFAIFFVILQGLQNYGYNFTPFDIQSGERVYNSELYHFALKYPATWAKYESEENGFHGRKFERLRIYDGVLQIGPPGQVTIDQIPFENPTSEIIATQGLEIISDYIETFRGESLDYEFFGSQEYLTRTYQIPDGFCKEVYIPRKMDGIIIRISGNLTDQQQIEYVFERIVVSFRDTTVR